MFFMVIDKLAAHRRDDPDRIDTMYRRKILLRACEETGCLPSATS